MKKSTVVNLIFTILVLAAALGLLIWRSHRPAAEHVIAQLTYGDKNTRMEIPLDQDTTYQVDTGYYVVNIEVKDGKARFYDSPCPDHKCEGFGWISAEDQQAICIPAHAVLMVVPAA